MPDRGKRVRTIAEQALTLAGAERDSFLEDSCGTDEALLSEVQALISDAESAGSFMEEPPDAPTIITDPALKTPGNHPTKIAHFTIRRVIGSGGMGTVYEGIQDNPRRKVAIKVMRSGVTSRTAQRRFEFESQVLARLHHQGIAQIYEAGTWDDGTGGVPWFAMEYIAGAKTLIDYSNARKLGTRERLELFTRVCDAVSHGHQKGIIHRDLKPGNILVDANGQPKVIDFGVARATDSDMAVTTLQTDVGQLLGTVQYMSPEQCEADPDILDTRSDVYSLGVLLYELLCDALPYDLGSVPVFEAARVIREKAPSRPSTIDRTLRGDVETIVLKALQKDRNLRYQSTHELQRDIQRYLDNEPIEARPPSITYQLKVFARRNRGLFVSAAAIAAILVSATVVSISMAVHAMQSADAAREAEERMTQELHRQKLQEAFLSHVLALPTPRFAQGRQLTAKDLLEAAGNDIDDWYAGFEDVQGSPELAEDMHVLIGNYLVELGQFEAAEQHLLPALADKEEHLGRDHWKTMYTLMTIAQMRFGQGHPREALQLSGEVEEWVRQGGDSWGPIAMELMIFRVEILEYMGLWKDAASICDELLDRMDDVQFDKINNGVTQEEIELRIKGLLGRNLMFSSQLDPDIDVRTQSLKRSWQVMEEVVKAGSEFKSMGPRHPVVLSTNATLTLCQWGNGEVPLQEVEDILREVELVHGQNSMLAMRLQIVKGSIMYGKMQLSQSEQVLRDIVAMIQDELDPDHPYLQQARMYLGRTLARSEKFEEAEPLLRSAVEALSERLEPGDLEFVITQGIYGMCLQGLGRFEEAEPYHDQFILELEKLTGPAHREPLAIRYLAINQYFKHGRQEEAFRRMRAFLEHCRNVLPEGDANLIKYQTELGDMLRDSDRPEEAIEVFEQTHADAMEYLEAGNNVRWAALSDIQDARRYQGDLDGALIINDQILADAREALDLKKVAWGIGGRLQVLQGTGREEEVDQILDAVTEEWWDDPEAMNRLAWNMADDWDTDLARIRYRDEMLRIAQRACELTDHVDPSNLDTLARVHYQRGEIDLAISTQEQAIEAAPEAEIGTYRDTLKRYEEALAEVESPAGTP